MEIGSFVALLVEKYNERPQIGRVKEVKRNMVRVEWYDGTWNGKWKIYKYWEGRRKVVWEEDLDKTCIVSKKICFTQDNCLDSNTKKELRIVYK